MITVEQAVKVLEYFDFGCAIMDDGSVFITRHPATDDPLFTQGGSAYEPEDAKDMALRALYKSEEVMERVYSWLRVKVGGIQNDPRPDAELIKLALSLGIKPEQMMGVE